jgi:hypothetical protein
MSASELEKLMLGGNIPSGLEGQVLHLIDETPTALLAGAVKQLAAKKNMQAKQMWKNLAQIAAQIQTTNKFWNSVG